MVHVDYSAAGVPVRNDLTESHAELLEHLRSGTWWTGAELDLTRFGHRPKLERMTATDPRHCDGLQR